MQKYIEKVEVEYSIIGNKGFAFNSSTYNIQNRNNSNWTTSISLASAEIDIKFPAHIISHIEFSLKPFYNKKAIK